ncbi:ArnT family glycosyltransferase [Acidobacteriota bacterium]
MRAKRARRLLRWAVASAWFTLIIFWLLSIQRAGIPFWISRAVAVACLVSTALLGLAWVCEAWTGPDRQKRRASFLLLLLLLIALAVRLAGMDYGAVERFNSDEGIYTHHASGINNGDFFRRMFVYPHLTLYLDAFCLWVANLFSGTVLWVTQALFDVGTQSLAGRLVLRFVVALIGAWTVVPVFRMGERLAGMTGAAVGSGLIIFSPLYNYGAHFYTTDVPAAFFAACCLFYVVRLLEEETTKLYILAGLFSGFAAASKYPAGLVAFAIVFVFIRNRIVKRDLNWGLVKAGLVSLAAFVIFNPSLLVFHDTAFQRERGLLFGMKIYKEGAWYGVVAQSNTLYYLEKILFSFGIPAVLLGCLGLFLLDRKTVKRIAWLLPFPVLYFLLITSVTIVVERNLYALLPPISVFLGAGTAGLIGFLQRRTTRGPALQAAAAAALILGIPVYNTITQDICLANDDTRAVAREWIRANIPKGAYIVKESYTPNLPREEYDGWQIPRFAIRADFDAIRQPACDFLLLSSYAYKRFQDEKELSNEALEIFKERYRPLFESFPVVREFRPSWKRLGPELHLYRLEPEKIIYTTSATYGPYSCFVPDRAMRPGDTPHIQYTRDGQWCAVKGFFEPGTYNLSLEGEIITPGRIRLVGIDNRRAGVFEFDDPSGTQIKFKRPTKFFIYIHLQQGSTITKVEITRIYTPAGRVEGQ